MKKTLLEIVEEKLFDMNAPHRPWNENTKTEYRGFLLEVENADYHMIRTVKDKKGEVVLRYIDGDGLDFIKNEAFK